jgi:polysaccharide deacetylase family protein (PEP-CTERM system associated)
MIINALSIDVEEYYHGMEFEAAVPAPEREQLPSRVEESVEKILALLGALSVRATFFTVGQVAERHPAMIRRISQQGHEVACHSYKHELVWRQTPAEFRADVRRARVLLEELTGTAVVGYRAPNYSIRQDQTWAYDILLEEGFLYDSSVYPIFHDRYGDPDAPRFPYVIRQNGEHTLIEFPIGTLKVFGMNLPIGGGGYFRLLPGAWAQRGIQRVNRLEGQPVMFYFHPWELDPHHPRPPMPWRHSFRHYVGIEKQEMKLFRLLRHCRFGTVKEALQQARDSRISLDH